MKAVGVLVVILGVVAAILVGVFLITPSILEEDYIYKGDLTFFSEEEFLNWKSNFKGELVGTEGKLLDYNVLSSDPPILVSWEAGIPYDQEFSHGSTGDSRGYRLFAVIGLSIIAVLFLGVAPSVFFGLWD